MLDKLVWLFFLTFLPVFELRLTIPLGILSQSVNLPFFGTVSGYALPWQIVFVVCVAANILVSPIVFLALRHLLHFFLRIKKIKRFYERLVIKTQKKAEPLVKKYGFWGLAFFVGIPLPGTGAWTGALACFLLGMDLKKTVAANTAGVMIAGMLVAAIALAGDAGLKFLGI